MISSRLQACASLQNMAMIDMARSWYLLLGFGLHNHNIPKHFSIGFLEVRYTSLSECGVFLLILGPSLLIKGVSLFMCNLLAVPYPKCNFLYVILHVCVCVFHLIVFNSPSILIAMEACFHH